MTISNKMLLLAVAVTLLQACQPNSQSGAKQPAGTGPKPAPAPQETNARGTVDGGGGNSVANPNSGERTLLDLAENIDKEPYDLNVKKLLKLDQPVEGNANIPERALAFEKYIAYNNLTDSEFMKRLIGVDEEFFIWALRTALTTNEELASGFFTYDITYQMHLEAYQLTGDKIVKSVSYAMVDKELPDFGDTGIVQISNPETKKQLAVQDKTGFVLIDRNEFNKLNLESQIALKIHETVLYLILKFNPELVRKQGTAPIRDFVKNIFNYAYVSQIKKTTIVSPEKVKQSYLALGFPKIQPNYSSIAEISDKAPDRSLDCKLKQPILPNGEASSNYVFEKNGQDVSGAYSMGSDFFFKVQLHLVKTGICTFKPDPCTIKFAKMPWEKVGGYRLFANDIPLPDSAADFLYLQDTVKKKYQIARICQ